MEIKIEKQKETEKGWDFLVEIEGIEYLVKLDKEYWNKLTNGQYSPGQLVEKSFQFLLEREPKESILREFNLREINKYFPEYEKEIKRQIP